MISNMNYQIDQALLNQLQSAGVPVGAETAGARHPAKAVLQPTNSSLFDFMSVQNFSHNPHGPGSAHASASQSTRHGGGKKFDRLNLTTNLQGIGSLAAQSTTNAGSSDRRGGGDSGLGRAGASTNSRLMQYEASNNRNSLGAETESYGASQVDTSVHHSIQNPTPGQPGPQPRTTRPAPKQLVLKSSDRTIKLSKALPMGKNDLAAATIKMPASTKNAVAKKQLEGGGFSKRLIAESLATSVVVNDSMQRSSQASGKNASYMNDASLLMQAVSSQMQTPHGQQKIILNPKGSNSNHAPTQQRTIQGSSSRRKPSIQASNRAQIGSNQAPVHHGASEPTKLQQF